MPYCRLQSSVSRVQYSPYNQYYHQLSSREACAIRHELTQHQSKQVEAQPSNQAYRCYAARIGGVTVQH